MARPKSDDPKMPVALRLPASVLARWEALPDWRQKAEAVLTNHVAPRAGIVVEAKRRAPAVHVDVPMLVRKPFNPQQKTGKR